MTILVDRPRWLWRGERWSHLATDHDLDELHEFALGVGLRRLAFQGDHYDLPQRRLDAALDRGATLVDSRELVRRLRDAGLRHRRSMAWDRRIWWEEGNGDDLGRRLRELDAPRSIGDDIATVEGLRHVVVLRRPSEWGVGLTLSAPPDLGRFEPTHRRWVVTTTDGHHVDWFVPDPAQPPAVDS